MISGGHGEVNPNSTWHNSRGAWLSYITGLVILHVLLLSIPIFSVPIAWTLTNFIHNMMAFLFLHVLKGTPWHLQDQGKARLMTAWEQIDYGRQLTSSRRLLTAIPVVMYLLACFYTKYQFNHFIINSVTLVMVLVPKLPQFHLVRLFGINKY
uniref:ORM1-like protein 2 n=1 Tax=Hirondellea gigas TaxID=1518452 RepID=A0A2P2IAY5_9CRUS